MCGIVGGYTLSGQSNFTERLRSALTTIQHRGPDNQGAEVFGIGTGQLLLGQARLSIIDLSAAGHQPMHSHNGQYTVVFNGEIYNYQELREELKLLGFVFHTQTDTEVLLAAWEAWGTQAIPRFTGMFAFAVYDHQMQKLILVRDGFGIKPLLFHVNNGNLCFASEPAAIIALLDGPPAPNVQRALDYLAYGLYDHNEDTFFDGIYQLMPAHFVEFDLNTASMGRPVRWWWPSIKERKDLTFDQAAEKLRDLFLQNIRLHMRSDVPLGAALSGGLDSSSVVAAMRQVAPQAKLHTFTYVALGSDKNEEAWADQVIQHTHATAHKIYVDPAELMRDLDDMIRQLGEPFGSTSIYAQYRVFKAAREAGIVVTLDGQGADELLAGYNGYPVSFMQSLIEKGHWFKAIGFIKAWTQWPGRSKADAIAVCKAAIAPDWAKKAVDRILKSAPLPEWLNKDYFQKQQVRITPPRATFKSWEGKKRRLAEQLRSALLGAGLAQLLRHGDRTSMRWSLESRVPFLTTELAEFLLTLPEEYLLSNDGQTKSIFRAAMRGIVPDSILDRRDKIGFETPEYGWLKGNLEQIKQWMMEAPDLPFINRELAIQEVEAMMQGKIPYDRRAWRVLNYYRWASLTYPLVKQ